LQAQHEQLLAMLPGDVSDFDGLDADQFNAKLLDIELTASEMLAISAAERAILEELERR
jgi:hypothetical protein